MPASEEWWVYLNDNVSNETYTKEELKQIPNFSGDTFVKPKNGIHEWKKASQYRKLQDLFHGPPNPPKAQKPEPPSLNEPKQRKETVQQRNYGTLTHSFGNDSASAVIFVGWLVMLIPVGFAGIVGGFISGVCGTILGIVNLTRGATARGVFQMVTAVFVTPIIYLISWGIMIALLT